MLYRLFPLFFCLWLVPALGQNQEWLTVKMNPSVGMSGIQFFEDGQNGWAVGGSSVGGLYISTVLHTTNGGNTWQELNFPYDQVTRLTAVHFPNPQKGWVVGETGKIYHTPNGGQSWVSQSSGTLRDLASVHFIDEQTGWAVGGWQDGTSFLVLKTTNGGATWQNLSFGNTAFSVSDVWFVDANRGWITARKNTLAPAIWYTADGGLTWAEQSTPLSTSNIDLPSIEFTSERNGWAVTSSLYFPGSVLHTTDGGATWEIVGQTNHAYNVLSVRDSMSVAVAGVNILSPSSEKIFVTTDAGQSWNSYTPPFLHYSWGIDFVGGDIWFAGNNTAILHSGDQGLNWELQHYSPLLKSIDWSDPNNGWAVAGYVFGVQKYWTRSIDGGETWSVDLSLPAASDIQWLDDQTGWVLFENNGANFWRTTNGGVNWTPHALGTSSWTEGFFFADADHGWAFGSNGNLRGTLNGGVNWYAQSLTNTLFVQKAFFVNPTTGWAGGGYGSGNGFIVHTIDGGANWVEQTPAVDGQVTDICFLDKSVGWAGTVGGYVQKTTDGGNTWQLVSQLNHPYLERLIFLDTLRGWVAMRNGTGTTENGKGFIYRTEDGGASWMLQWAGAFPSSGIEDFRLEKDSSAIWAVGQHNTILKYILIEDPSATGEADAALAIQLFPALPNPFGESVQLRFTLPNGGPGDLQVFDISGHLLSEWSRENWNAGSHTVNWDTREIPPGFYICRLEAQGAVRSQKLLKF